MMREAVWSQERPPLRGLRSKLCNRPRTLDVWQRSSFHSCFLPAVHGAFGGHHADQSKISRCRKPTSNPRHQYSQHGQDNCVEKSPEKRPTNDRLLWLPQWIDDLYDRADRWVRRRSTKRVCNLDLASSFIGKAHLDGVSQAICVSHPTVVEYRALSCYQRRATEAKVFKAQEEEHDDQERDRHPEKESLHCCPPKSVFGYPGTGPWPRRTPRLAGPQRASSLPYTLLRNLYAVVHWLSAIGACGSSVPLKCIEIGLDRFGCLTQQWRTSGTPKRLCVVVWFAMVRLQFE